MNLGRYNKLLVAAGLGLVEAAAYIAADPRDLPPWLVTLALAVNAAGVYAVKNRPPPSAAALLARQIRQQSGDLPLPHSHDRPPPFDGP